MKISVIIPVYNVEKYLASCLQSIVNQTFCDWELIAVNDGSSDKSADILRQYAQDDARIKVITQPNGGVSAARNAGLKAAKGDFVCFVDSDDYVHPQMLELLLNAAEKENADAAIASFCREGELSSGTYQLSEIELEYGVADAGYYLQNVHKLNYSVSPKLIRRDFIGNLRFNDWSCAEDWCLNLELAIKGFRYVKLFAPLYVYVMNEASISHSPFSRKKLESYCAEAEYFYEKYHDDKAFAVLRKDFFRRLCLMAIGEARKAQSQSERHKLRREYASRLLRLYKCGAFDMRQFLLRQKIKFWLFVLRGMLKI